jgi:hypothetical protein
MVVEAAHIFGRFLGGQMTAAGKVFYVEIKLLTENHYSDRHHHKTE